MVGTPDECVDQLRHYLDLGFAGISCNLAAVRRDSMYEGLRETMEGAAEVVRALRS